MLEGDAEEIGDVAGLGDAHHLADVGDGLAGIGIELVILERRNAQRLDGPPP